MGQVTKMVIGPACGTHGLCRGLWDSGTLRRWFLDFVLPVLMLAAMSVLTVVLLVVVVEAAAELGSYTPSRDATPDPWTTACFGPAFIVDQQAYPDYPSPMQMLDGHGSASDQQPNDQVDTPWARWVPE
jgi:hypothetical protein